MPDFQSKQHVAVNGAPVQQAVLLQHIADVAGDALDLFPLDIHGAGRGLQQPGQNGQQRGFAAAAGPHDAHELALVHGKRYVLKGGDFSVLRLILLLYVLHPKNFQTHHLTPCNFL